MNPIARYVVLTSVAAVAACSDPAAEIEPSAYNPEGATGLQVHELSRAENYMVAAANPYAVDAGLDILAAGGSAIDAAVAVQSMLTLVEPQSSGIGGGAFIMYWDAAEQTLYTLDARETAPQAADGALFLDEEGEPLRWIDALVGGRSVGTPGIVKGLDAAHQRWGQLEWSRLFESTIAMADEGFVVSPRLSQLVEREINPGVRQLSTARDYFFPQGSAIEAGSRLRNPQLAESLTLIAEEGADGFYRGEMAQKIVDAVSGSEIAPGLLSLEDLAEYEVSWREPVCAEYRNEQICSMGPPSSGGVTVLQTLKMLERFDFGDYMAEDSEPWHYFTQASRLAFADRDRYLADPDYVDVPVAQMLRADYLRQRSELIKADDMGHASPGEFASFAYVDGHNYEQPGTTHISIVDSEGNAVSMTSTIEMGFGSGVMVGGFLLNNQLTDFSFVPRDEDGDVANRVEPGKRPRSSMAPVITFDQQGNVRHVVGSPGGPRIINYVGKTLIGLIDFNLDMQSAIDLPNVTNLNGATAIEEELAPLNWNSEFEERGHNVQSRSLNSGIHGITVLSDHLQGGADPRREGGARGQ